MLVSAAFVLVFMFGQTFYITLGSKTGKWAWRIGRMFACTSEKFILKNTGMDMDMDTYALVFERICECFS